MMPMPAEQHGRPAIEQIHNVTKKWRRASPTRTDAGLLSVPAHRPAIVAGLQWDAGNFVVQITIRRESIMYIGGGILGTILMVLLIVYLWRRV